MNNRKTVVVAVLILVAVWTYASCSEADAQTVGITIGPIIVAGDTCEFYSMNLTSEFADRRWIAGLTTHGDGVCLDEYVASNLAGWIVRETRLKSWGFGIGAGLREHGDIIVGSFPVNDVDDAPRTDPGAQLVAALHIRKYFGKRERVMCEIVHFSNGGASLRSRSHSVPYDGYNRGFNGVACGGRF